MDLSTERTNELLFATFNQDFSCLAAGTESGFFVCDADPLKERFRREFDDGGIGIVEMLFRSNILALVGGGKNPKYPKNKVMIWDDFQVQCIAELEFRSQVKGVRLRRDKIVAVLENKVYIYNFSDLKLTDQIETFSNPQGLCAVNASKDDMVLACLGENVGEVRVDLYSRNVSRIIAAHNNAISQMCLSLDGKFLATASDRGTLFRIFDTATGKKLKEFRRGAAQATIQSISFNKDGSALAVSSDHGTIHIFALDDNTENKQSSLSILGGVVSYLGSTWSSKQFSVPESKSLVSFGHEDKGRQYVIVVGGSGKYYKYSYGQDKNDCKQEGVESFLRTT